jgi:excinuclease UvrABC ATPase subunit
VTTVADTHDHIEVRGARENNLKNVDVDIPKRRLTVFTGVSGSGKSSLVFGTIAAESQRLINETYTAFVQGFLPAQARPDVDALRNLSAAIVIDQERMGANSRSTVGTATDAHTMLRIIFSQVGEPHIGSSFRFSFNNPEGMCPACEGLGWRGELDLDELVDRSKSLNEGAITVPGFGTEQWYGQMFTRNPMFDADIKVAEFTEDQWQKFLYADAMKIDYGEWSGTFEGLVVKVNRTIIAKDRDKARGETKAFIERAVTYGACSACEGSRLNDAARSCRINGRNIADLSAMQISDLVHVVAAIEHETVAPLVAGLVGTLTSLVEIGLGYLSLNRESGTLSGGEAQRVKMVRHLGSSLSDITYVFDEPSIGLHPHDIRRMNTLLKLLRDKGNTVLVVEHKPEVIAIADHVVDLGPRAGAEGGSLTYEGDVSGLRRSGTLTGDHLDRRPGLRPVVRKPTGQLEIVDAGLHNLQDVSVQIPLGVITAVTGVAGSGKTSLIHGCLPRRSDVQILDQSAIRGSRRSNPATYTGLLDSIRTAFAKANNVKASLFSANSEGACKGCNGLGLIYTDLAFMMGVASTCEDCKGKRFTPEVLTYRLQGRNIADVLAMSVDQAKEFLPGGQSGRILTRLVDVGLGYVSLGQPLNTLSGGERQRLKLAIQMAGDAAVYVLDEPTTGLHMADVDQLLGLLDQLVDSGNSVIVIEHHLAVIAHADHVIDLGPGAGHDGGRIVFEGTPAQLADDASTLTGQHLAEYLVRT